MTTISRNEHATAQHQQLAILIGQGAPVFTTMHKSHSPQGGHPIDSSQSHAAVADLKRRGG